MNQSSSIIAEALQTPAHPMWGRMVWRLLYDSRALDEKELKRIGIYSNDLWTIDNISASWTYGKWFSLIEHAYMKLGPATGVLLAETALLWPAPYTATIVETAPSLRAWFHFWETLGSKLDVSHVFKSKPIQNGVRYSLGYRMEGVILEAFVLSCMAIIKSNIAQITGRTDTFKCVHNRPMSDFVRREAWSNLGIEIDIDLKQEESISWLVPDSLLDETSIGADSLRFNLALQRFNQLADGLKAGMATPSLADVVVSYQITSLKPIPMERMAEKVDLKVENYRKKLRECGTSHRELVKQCVTFNAERMIEIGLTQSEICERMGMSEGRLRRFMSDSP